MNYETNGNERWLFKNITTGKKLVIHNPQAAGNQAKSWVTNGYKFTVDYQEQNKNGEWI